MTALVLAFVTASAWQNLKGDSPNVFRDLQEDRYRRTQPHTSFRDPQPHRRSVRQHRASRLAANVKMFKPLYAIIIARSRCTYIVSQSFGKHCLPQEPLQSMKNAAWRTLPRPRHPVKPASIIPIVNCT